MTITQSEIDDLRAKLAKATPGEWRLFNRNRTLCVHTGRPSRDLREIIQWMGFASSDYQKKNVANAALIVAAKNALPDLLDLAPTAIAARERAIRECAVTLEKRAANHRDQVRYCVERGSPSLADLYRMRATEAECCAAAILYPIPTQNGRDDA